MAEIVAVARFSPPGGNTFSSYLNYIDRDEAILHDKSSLDSMYSGYMDYMDDDAKVIASDQLEPGSRRALFTTWKDNLTGKEKTDIKKAFRNAQDAGSNLWQVVISFENQYLEDCGLYDSATKHLNEALLKQAGRRAIDTMLRAEHMENALWTAAIHHNTDNFHIHVAIVEPTPMFSWYPNIRRTIHDVKELQASSFGASRYITIVRRSCSYQLNMKDRSHRAVIRKEIRHEDHQNRSRTYAESGRNRSYFGGNAGSCERLDPDLLFR